MTRRLLSILALLLLAALGSTAARGEEFDHSAWNRVLRRYVTETGRVDYGALKSDSADLDSYVAQLAARSPVSHPRDFPSREAQLAYWINAYNALTMKGVVAAWPVKSVREIGTLPYSFFWRKKFTAGGRKYTLNGIEDILRKQLSEPRIHFAIVCASNSCPRLERTAYTAENVERLLEAHAREFVNDPRNLQIDGARNRVTLARIYTFYREDFEKFVSARNSAKSEQPILDYVRLYASDANRRALAAMKNPRVEDFEYDWGINDVNAPASPLAHEGGQP